MGIHVNSIFIPKDVKPNDPTLTGTDGADNFQFLDLGKDKRLSLDGKGDGGAYDTLELSGEWTFERKADDSILLRDHNNNVLTAKNIEKFNVNGRDVDLTKLAKPASIGSLPDNNSVPFTRVAYPVNPFKQSSGGNCGFLASLQAVSEDADGRKILDQSITMQKGVPGLIPDQYYVKFRGDKRNLAVKVTEDDIKAYAQQGKLSSGDPKMQLLEVAADKYFTDYDKETTGGKGTMNGVNPEDALRLLTGQQGSTKALYTKDMNKDILKAKLYAIADTDGLTLTFAGAIASNGNPTTDPSKIAGFHGFSVSKIDTTNGIVTYKNPWNTGQEETMTMDDFLNYLTDPATQGLIDYTEVYSEDPDAAF